MPINSYTETRTHLLTHTIMKLKKRKETFKKQHPSITISEIIYKPYITAITINSYTHTDTHVHSHVHTSFNIFRNTIK